jgi:MFS family permease
MRSPARLRDSVARRPTFAAIVYTTVAVLPLFLVSAGAVELQRDLDFGKAQLGLAVSICFIASALVSPSLGHHIERVGPSLRLPAMLSFAALAWIGILARSWWEIVVALVLCGVANAIAQVSTNVALTGVVDRRQGIAFGAKQSGVPMASLIAGLAMPAIALVAGWRAGFAGAAVIASVAVISAPTLEGHTGSAAEHTPWRPTKLLAALCLTGLCAGAVGNSLAVFTVDAAVAQGMTQSAGGLLLAAGSTVAIATRLAAGWLVDRRRSNGLGELMALTVLSVAAFVLLRLSGASDALFVVGVLVGFAGGWGWQGLIHYATVRSHRGTPAASSGYVLTAIYIGMIVGPVTIGLVAQHLSYTRAWLVSALFSFVAVLAAFGARRLARPPAGIRLPPDEARVPLGK